MAATAVYDGLWDSFGRLCRRGCRRNDGGLARKGGAAAWRFVLGVIAGLGLTCLGQWSGGGGHRLIETSGAMDMKTRTVSVVQPSIEHLEARECFSAVGFMGGVTVAAGDVSGDAVAPVAMGDGSVRFLHDPVQPGGAFKGGIYVAGGVVIETRD